MARRSYGISSTQISRMISASNSASQARQRAALIDSQANIETEKSPEYAIEAFDFDTETRVSHIEFSETKKYRKIERYVTQNGVRYPIYGDWNTRTKAIKKTIRLTNDALERLNENDDDLVSLFCHEIVELIDNEDLYPSWFVIDALKAGQKQELKDTNEQYNIRLAFVSDGINSDDSGIKECETAIEEEYKRLLKTEKKLNGITARIVAAEDKKHRVLYSILTLGIYLLFCSKKHISALYEKKTRVEEKHKEINKEINEKKATARALKQDKAAKTEKSANLKKEKEKAIADIKNTYKERINAVAPLPTVVESNLSDVFIPLKTLCGMNYEKIVGCYVIRNTENSKCYVGQSKDVLKRVCKQHFTGTKVKNIIFAEDYFSSKLENKDDLFEVRIIRLQTKDELDSTEMRLIEQYDSFNNGYNSTGGNN